VHHLSVSSNAISSNFKYYQSAVNRQKFIEKHGVFYNSHAKLKTIAFYLPQFHEIKQNSYWWGKNYTEWRAATSAQPQFKGHYQPHLPAELGFYDLVHPEAFERQAAMARRYGIHGFCFYYYNFGDVELMEKALEAFLLSKADINFCLCWANENWTRNWDGQNQHVLMEQKCNDDKTFLEVLKKMERFITDERYINVDGKPLILIYRESLFDGIKKKLDGWRAYWYEQYNQNLYLGVVDSLERSSGVGHSPNTLGFDVAVEVPAHGITTRIHLEENEKIDTREFNGMLINYADAVEEVCTRSYPDYKRIPGCFPSWDNTPRRAGKSVIFRDATPTAFQVFLEMKAKEAHLLSGNERMLFINAWNEWGEGAHLEPDLRYGHAWLSVVDKVTKEF